MRDRQSPPPSSKPEPEPDPDDDRLEEAELEELSAHGDGETGENLAGGKRADQAPKSWIVSDRDLLDD